MTNLPKLHVAVLMGGWSSERPVSLMSGEGVARALEVGNEEGTVAGLVMVLMGLLNFFAAPLLLLLL